MDLEQLVSLVQGRVVGGLPSSVAIMGVCTLDEPQAGCLAFSRSGAVQKLRKAVSQGQAAAVLIPEAVPEESLPKQGIFIKVKDPQAAFIVAIQHFHTPIQPKQEIHPTAVIDPSATIGKEVAVGAFVVIGAGSVIGDSVTIHPHVTIYPQVTIGARSTIHAGAILRERIRLGNDVVIQCGAVIGADGFGYIPDRELGLRAVPQIGTVELGDRVEIGANTCVDRGALRATAIGLGTKIDNQVQIGHNVRIGEHSVICGQVGIGGSAVIGDQVTLAGQVGVADHINIASGTKVGGASVVLRDCPEAMTLAGIPAIEAGQWKRSILRLYRNEKRRSGEGGK